MRKFALLLVVIFSLVSYPPALATVFDIDFNTGEDSRGNSQGELIFDGPKGFQITFTDDGSNGSFGGDANGVHITNENYGNIKVGSSTDKVLGAYNSYAGTSNYHSSGIVARFSEGVQLVRFNDTDDDGTKKAMFAFDVEGNLIGQTIPASRVPVMLDILMTGGKMIHSVEFDTEPGSRGGSLDGTYFTIDDFHVEYCHLFCRGDAYDDGLFDISDPIKVFRILFLEVEEISCRDSFDSDDSGSIDINDGVYLLNFLFLNGSSPPSPFPGCGCDTTNDALDCRRYSHC